MKNLTRNCFLATLVEDKENKDILNALLEEMTSNLQLGGTVLLTGFGTLKTRDKGSRPGRNPKTGEPHQVDARRIVILGKSNVDPDKLGGIRMTRADMADKLYSYGFDKTLKELKDFVTNFIEWVSIPDLNRNIQLRNFGTFTWRKRKAGMVTCPSKGGRVWSEETILAVFNPGKALKDSVNIYNT